MDQATPLIVAKWMVGAFDSAGILDQHFAAHGIEERFGSDFVYINENANLAIDRRVLQAFRDLTGDDVIWSSGDLAWRRREPWDRPGRKG